MPSTVVVGSADEMWLRDDTKVELLILDLSTVTYLDVTGMVYLAARLGERAHFGARTVVRLPRSRPVREQMRNWQFPKAVMDATGESFYGLVHPEDRVYFGERIDKPDQNMTGRSDRIPAHYFPIQSFFKLSGHLTYQLLVQQSSAWQDRYVLTVLNTYLGDHGRLVANNVMHEALDNSIQHPYASLLQTGSIFQPGKDERLAQLTIVVWDDGESIIDTLRLGLTAYGPQTPGPANLHRDFRVRYLDGEGSPEVRTVTRSDVIVTPDAQAADLLLAALFPGVTSRPPPPPRIPHQTVGGGALAVNGMGLHILTNTILDVFGGSLAIRTSEYFASLKPSKRGTTAADPGLPPVDAKIVKRSDDRFPGNMITLRIPLSTSVLASSPGSE